MTILITCKFGEGIIMMADSRVTYSADSARTYADDLRKILYVGPKSVIGYAGDVALAGLIANHLRASAAKNPHLQYLPRLATQIPRVALHYCRSGYQRAPNLDLVSRGCHGSRLRSRMAISRTAFRTRSTR